MSHKRNEPFSRDTDGENKPGAVSQAQGAEQEKAYEKATT